MMPSTVSKSRIIGVAIVVSFLVSTIGFVPPSSGYIETSTFKYHADKVDQEVLQKIQLVGRADTIILLREGVDKDIYVTSLGLAPKRTFSIINAIQAELTKDTIESVIANKDTKHVFLNREIHIPKSDLRFDNNSQTHNIGALEIGTPYIGADNVSETGAGVIVAIVDTGIQDNHTWLQRDGSSVVKWEKDVTGENVNDYSGYHGTHVAGIIASQHENNKGVAPGVDLYDIIISSDGYSTTSAKIVAGLQVAAEGPDEEIGTADDAKVINLSFGSLFYPSYGNDLASLAINELHNLGHTICVSAGNGFGFGTIATPSLAEHAISVGATDRDIEVTDFSSKGPAPWGRMYPSVVAPGLDILSSVPVDSSGSISGTSTSAPHVAGVAALLLQAHPQWSSNTIKQAIMNSAVDIDSPVVGSSYAFSQGAGLVNYKRARDLTLWISKSNGAPCWNARAISGSADNTTLIIRNTSNENVTVSLFNENFRDLVGNALVTVTFSQQTFVLEAGADILINATIHVQNPTRASTYAGYIVATDNTGSRSRLPVSLLVPIKLSSTPTGELFETFSGNTSKLGFEGDEYIDFEVEFSDGYDMALVYENHLSMTDMDLYVIPPLEYRYSEYGFSWSSSFRDPYETVSIVRPTAGVWHIVIAPYSFFNTPSDNIQVFPFEGSVRLTTIPGVQGPQGPQGVPGPAGPPGPQGPSWITPSEIKDILTKIDTLSRTTADLNAILRILENKLERLEERLATVESSIQKVIIATTPVKIIEVPPPGGTVEIFFDEDNLPITKLAITAVREIKGDVLIQVLSEWPDWAAQPPGIVYSLLNTTAENIDWLSVEKVSITFTVDRAWINDRNIDVNKIALLKYDPLADNWIHLKTTLIGESLGKVYFVAESDSFSSFAIVGYVKTPSVPIETIVIVAVITIICSVIGVIAYRKIKYWMRVRYLE